MKTECLLFGAKEWCASCRKLSPILKEVADEMKGETLKFTEVDVESDWGVDMSCKYQVRNVPTILVVKQGRVVERIAGTRTKNELKEIFGKWK